jgi:hypothetical protein
MEQSPFLQSGLGESTIHIRGSERTRLNFYDLISAQPHEAHINYNKQTKLSYLYLLKNKEKHLA